MIGIYYLPSHYYHLPLPLPPLAWCLSKISEVQQVWCSVRCELGEVSPGACWRTIQFTIVGSGPGYQSAVMTPLEIMETIIKWHQWWHSLSQPHHHHQPATMEMFIMILLVNIVNVSEIVNPNRIIKMRKDPSLGREKQSDVISRNNSEDSEEDKSGNRTTLTFSEMVGIYHDIWNTMLMGGGVGGKRTRIYPCISSVMKWKVPENSLEIQCRLDFLEFASIFSPHFRGNRTSGCWGGKKDQK